MHVDGLLDGRAVAGDGFAGDASMKRLLVDIDVDERIRGLKEALLPQNDQCNDASVRATQLSI